jgi:hypothetical protein
MCEVGDEELSGIPPKVQQAVQKQWVHIGYYIDENGVKRKGTIRKEPWQR